MIGLVLLLVLVLAGPVTADYQLQFSQALHEGDAGEVERLLEAHPELVNADFGRGARPLFRAVHLNRPEMVRLFLARGADLEAKTERGNTAVHAAAATGHTYCYDLLADHQADPNRPNQEGQTPLWLAVRANHRGLVRRLLEAGADPNRVDRWGVSCLHLAAAAGRAELTQVLLEAGANPKVSDDQGRTPADMAWQNRRIDWKKVRRLLEGR